VACCVSSADHDNSMFTMRLAYALFMRKKPCKLSFSNVQADH
jgi:hypothetical protein